MRVDPATFWAPEKLEHLGHFERLARAAAKEPLDLLESLRSRTITSEELDVLLMCYPMLALEVFNMAPEQFLELLSDKQREALATLLQSSSSSI